MTRLLAAALCLLWATATQAQNFCGSGSPVTWKACSGYSPLAVLKSANFNILTDQAIPIAAAVYHVEKVVVTNCTVTPLSAQGGLYTGQNKTGIALLGAAQSYTISAQGGLELVNLGAGTPYRLTAAMLYLSLSKAQGAPATCDVYVMGDNLS